MIKDIITTSYAALKKSKAGDFQNVKSELDLLGVDYDDNSLAIAHRITQSSKSFKDSLNNLDKHEKTGTIDSILSEVNAGIKKKKKAKAIKLQKKAAEFAAEQQRKEDGKAAYELNKKKLQEAEIFNFSLQITDYMIVRGKFRAELESEVRSKMREGWVPFGGVSAAAFGISPTGGNSFIQAMVRY